MSKPRVLAFYLPQFHPIPENDIWWGKGFTEWTNVAKTKPLYFGHDQPKIPKDLGFYDLRLIETQLEQIKLAKKSGIEGFCYYHYWFGNGKVLLEKPIKSVLVNRNIDFPFCFCWANHNWMKQDWNAAISRMDISVLIEQCYHGDTDYIQHFNYVLPFFKDSRYIKVNEKPVFVIYAIKKIPNLYSFIEIWQELAKQNGFPGIHFIGYRQECADDIAEEPYVLCDGVALEMMLNIKYGSSSMGKRINKLKRCFLRLFRQPEFLVDYRRIYKRLVSEEIRNENVYPVVVPNFDHSPRRGSRGLILKNTSPETFKLHLIDVFEKILKKHSETNLVFIKSWNEWGEGNYIEPDLKYGSGYIDTLNEVLNTLK